MKKPVLCLIALALCFAGTSLYASTILSEDFNSIPSNQTGLTFTSAGQFNTINGTNIDIVSAGNGWAPLVVSPETGNVVDLGGTGGKPLGQLQVALNLKKGNYDLSFDLVGSQRANDGAFVTDNSGDVTKTHVTLGTLYDQLFTLESNDDTSGIVKNAAFYVPTDETVFLTFELTDTGNPNIGSLLDDVSVVATPEPGSLLLLGTGLTALAGLVRRRFGAHSA